MSIEVTSPAPASGLPFLTALAWRDLIFVSGLVGRDPATGQIARGDVAEQTRQALANIRRHLEAAGTSPDWILKTMVFLTDMRLFAALNEVYRAFFSAHLPARSCVAVTALPDADALVEIEVIAARG